MGFDRGQIVTYNIFKCDIPISRHDVCRSKILMIREILSLKMHIVYDESNIVRLCKLTEKGTKHIHQINVFRTLFNILVRNSYVFFAFESGDIDFFEVRYLEEIIEKVVQQRISTFTIDLSSLKNRY